jgi:hypothetical protein
VSKSIHEHVKAVTKALVDHHTYTEHAVASEVEARPQLTTAADQVPGPGLHPLPDLEGSRGANPHQPGN